MSLPIVFISILIAVIVGIVVYTFEQKKVSQMTPEERDSYEQQKKQESDIYLHGQVSPKIICPHCQESGYVHTKSITQKKGISGAKATGAVLTGGLSILATGLSRKEASTEAYCSNCEQMWHF